MLQQVLGVLSVHFHLPLDNLPASMLLLAITRDQCLTPLCNWYRLFVAVHFHLSKLEVHPRLSRAFSIKVDVKYNLLLFTIIREQRPQQVPILLVQLSATTGIG